MKKQKTEFVFNPTVHAAALEFISRRDRVTHPAGEFDSAGRWYPTKKEGCECCDYIRKPSGRYPYSLLTHCRSSDHVANLFNVQSLDLKREVRRIDPRRAKKEFKALVEKYDLNDLLSSPRPVFSL